MKSPKQPFRPELERTMHAAREKHAATFFDPVTVKSRLMTAAGEGAAFCVLEVPLDLRATAAAETIVSWCGQEGLRADWISQPAPEAHGEQAYNLVVSWRPVTKNV